jgi:hypothetical protein
MIDKKENRAHSRKNYAVPIEVSYISKGRNVGGQSLNHCDNGMCFESTSSFRPGATINIRVKDFHPHGPCKGICDGLRSSTLAEVRWCGEVSEADGPLYRAGVKFYAPVY